MKEQVARKIGIILKDKLYLWHDGRAIGGQEEAITEIINLFKAEVDKLTVIGDERVAELLGVNHWGCLTNGQRADVKTLLERQLQDCKDKLLDLMGE